MGNDGAAFFGSGGASAPTTLVEQAFEGSASRHLPWDSAVTVRKRLLCAYLCKNPNICQGNMLGTNIGKVEKHVSLSAGQSLCAVAQPEDTDAAAGGVGHASFSLGVRAG